MKITREIMIIKIGMIVIEKAIVRSLVANATAADVTRSIEARGEGGGGVLDEGVAVMRKGLSGGVREPRRHKRGNGVGRGRVEVCRLRGRNGRRGSALKTMLNPQFVIDCIG